MSEPMFSGWGIRTVATTERRYNPMSYHNGSAWPRDNALIALGFARYGFQDHTLQLFTGLMQASTYLDLHRLPELFCGFPRRPAEGPTPYPVACAPQAWSAAEVWINHLMVGDATVDLLLERHQQGLGVNVLRKEGELEIVMVR